MLQTTTHFNNIKFLNLQPKPVWQWAIITLLITYQFIRLIVFANAYGGIEHDGGWHLGIARALAERGTYTTMVSSISDPTIAAGTNIHNQFELQDEDGRIYFSVESTTGPTNVILNAVVLNLFGSGFWQFRAVSLLAYLLLLILASWLLFATGGFAATLLFHTYIFFYPHLFAFLGYSALGEMTAIVCIVLAFALCLKAATSETKRLFLFFLSGLAAGLAINSKLLSLLSLSGLGVLWLTLYLRRRATIKEGLTIALGTITFPLGWELIEFFIINYLYGFEIYIQHIQQRFNVFLTAGSGLAEEATAGAELLWYKLFLISEISHPNNVLSLINLMVIAVGGPFLIWYFRKTQLHQSFVILFWSGWFSHTLWFLTAAETGWVRHYWFALILGMLILSLLWSNLLSKAKTSPTWLNLSAAIALTVLIGLNIYSQRQAATIFLSDRLIENWYQQHLAAARTRLPWLVVPRSDQEAAVDILQGLSASARVFYPEGHKSAEMAALSGRILYPIERRPFMPPSKGDVVVVGPSLISPWAKLMEMPMSEADRQGLINEVVKRIKQECPQVLFENSYYIICALVD
jgi:hypothetical protein